MSGGLWPPPAVEQHLAPRCSRKWPLADPSEYDKANGIVHHCDLGEHTGAHRCVCGATIDEVGR